MSDFENYVNLELPRRPVMITPALAGGYDADPNAGGAPALIANSPAGNYYFQQTAGIVWIKQASSPGTWLTVGGGGGGGVTIYATEVALLAATPTAGTMGYAQDTGSFWFRRASTWQPTPHPRVLRRVEGPYTITIDPVAGDDADWNDGTTTPLKTLEALFRRLPEVIHQSEPGYGGNTYWGDPAKTVSVLLKAGTHRLAPDAVSVYRALNVDLGNVDFYGEYLTDQTFNIDHWSNDDTRIWQPAGNPAWTADEHVGKVVTIDFGGIPYHFFVMANGTHDLTIAWGGAGYSAYFPTGTTVKLERLGTKWIGPRQLAVTGRQSASGYYGAGWGSFTGIQFDTTVEACPSFFNLVGGTIGFVGCRFLGSGGAWASKTAVMVQRHGCTALFGECLFENWYGTIQGYGGHVELNSNTCITVNRLVEQRGISSVQMTGAVMARNSSGPLIWLRQNGTLDFRYGSIFFCISSSGLFGFENPGGHLHAEGYGLVVLDGQMLTSIFHLSGVGNSMLLDNWALEASAPGTTIMLDLPSVNMSIADLKNVYGGDYDHGKGTRIVVAGP